MAASPSDQSQAADTLPSTAISASASSSTGLALPAPKLYHPPPRAGAMLLRSRPGGTTFGWA